MLPLDAGSGTGEAQTPTAQMVSERLSDMAIADAIRAVPGVLDMGQGVFARAATYGPGKHIAGIVFQHRAPGELSVEVHVVLDETTCSKLSRTFLRTQITHPYCCVVPTTYEPSYLKRLNISVGQYPPWSM